MLPDAHTRIRRVCARARTRAHLCLIISRGDRWGLVVTFDAGEGTDKIPDVAEIRSQALFHSLFLLIQKLFCGWRIANETPGLLLRFGLDILPRR